MKGRRFQRRGVRERTMLSQVSGMGNRSRVTVGQDTGATARGQTGERDRWRQRAPCCSNICHVCACTQVEADTLGRYHTL